MPTRMSLTLAILGVSITACSDAGVTKFNTDPTAEISSHADGDTVREGYAETLRGTVGDANHAIDELTVSWLVDGVDVCPDSAPDGEGLVTCDHTFAATGGEVLLEVRDPEGGSGSARVTVDVQPTDAPEAEITAPTQDGVYYSDQLDHAGRDRLRRGGRAFHTHRDVGVERGRRADGWVQRAGLGGWAAGGGDAVRGRALPHADGDRGQHRQGGAGRLRSRSARPTAVRRARSLRLRDGDAGPEGELVTFDGRGR